MEITPIAEDPIEQKVPETIVPVPEAVAVAPAVTGELSPHQRLVHQIVELTAEVYRRRMKKEPDANALDMTRAMNERISRDDLLEGKIKQLQRELETLT